MSNNFSEQQKNYETLKNFLEAQPPGPVDIDVELLAACWETLSGSHLEGMTPEKLHRIENPEWRPPLLCFDIERHGSTVLGSSRADLHHMAIDIDKKSVDTVKGAYRQLRPKADSLDVGPLCQEVADLIRNHRVNEKLKWHNDGSVFVKIGQVIPNTGGPKQTLEGRRGRFRKLLKENLGPYGWRQVRPNCFIPSRNNGEE